MFDGVLPNPPQRLPLITVATLHLHKRNEKRTFTVWEVVLTDIDDGTALQPGRL